MQLQQSASQVKKFCRFPSTLGQEAVIFILNLFFFKMALGTELANCSFFSAGFIRQAMAAIKISICSPFLVLAYELQTYKKQPTEIAGNQS